MATKSALVQRPLSSLRMNTTYQRFIGGLLFASMTCSLAVSCKKEQVASIVSPEKLPINDGNGDYLPDYAWSDPNGAVVVQFSLPNGAQPAPPPSPPSRWTWNVADPTHFRITHFAWLGDVNNDHFADLAVVEQSLAQETCADSKVHVFTGSRTGLSPTPQWTASDTAQALNGLGNSSPNDGGVGPAHGPAHFAQMGRILHRVAGDRPLWIASATNTPPRQGSSTENIAYCGLDELWLYRELNQQPTQRIVIETGTVTAIATGFLDGDTFVDLAVLVPPQIEIYRGNSSGFERTPTARLHDPHDDPQRVSNLAIDDVDGDGVGELLVTFEYSPTHDGLAHVGAVHFDPLSPSIETQTLVIHSDSTHGEGRSITVLRVMDPRTHRLTRQRYVVVADPETNSLFRYERFLRSNTSNTALIEPSFALRSPLGSEQFGSAMVALSRTGPLLVRAVDRQTARVQLWRLNAVDGGLQPLFTGQLLGEHPMALAALTQQIATQRPLIAATLGGYGGCDVPEPREQVIIDESRPDALQASIIAALNNESLTPAEGRANTGVIQTLADCHRAALRENCEHESRLQLTITGNTNNLSTIRGIAWIGPSRPDERRCVTALMGRELQSSQPFDESTNVSFTLRRGRAQQ